MKPKLIIVSGMPGVGKTTLAKNLSEKLTIPYICKDEIKEKLFDILDNTKEEECKKMGSIAYDIMYDMAWKFITNGNSVILESNFTDRSIESLKKFSKKAKITQIYCHADPEIVFKRFYKRHLSGNRHPKHVLYDNPDDFKKRVSNINYKLKLPGRLIEVDMNNSKKVNIAEIISSH